MLHYWVMKRPILLALLTLAAAASSFASKLIHTGFDMSRVTGIAFDLDGEEYVSAVGIGLLSVDDAEPIESVCANLFEGFSFFEEYRADSIAASDYHLNAGAAGWILQTYLSGASSANEAAALQIAVWDAIHDGGDGFGAGRIRSNIYSDSEVFDLAGLWVARSAGRNGDNAFVYAPAANSAAFQQQLYLATSDGGGGPDGEVPEPGTTALIAVGIAGMAAAARNRRAG